VERRRRRLRRGAAARAPRRQHRSAPRRRRSPPSNFPPCGRSPRSTGARRGEEAAPGPGMPAAAGDGLLSEPPGVAGGGGGGGGEARRAAAGAEGSFLAAWLSAAAAAPRERLRDFQHTKRVGNYLIGRKLGEGSFAKVREGLHVLTGEKVSGRDGTDRPGREGGRPLGGAQGAGGVPAAQGAVPRRGRGRATRASWGYPPALSCLCPPLQGSCL